MLKGAITALITPMKEDFSVDYEKLGTLIEAQILNQIDALLILGTTGEATTLSFSEQKAVLKFALEKVKGRVPVIANSGSNNTQEAIEKSQLFGEMGADYLLVITPYYNKTSPQGLVAHFTAIADTAPKPILLYHIPGRTGLSMPLEVLKTLSQHPNIVGIKEASGDIHYLLGVAQLLNENFALYSGDDDLTYTALTLGGSGTISTLSNLYPRYLHELIGHYFVGNLSQALDMQLTALPLIHHLFTETNPIPVKKAFSLLQKDMGPLRLPLVEMEASKVSALEKALADFQEVAE